MSDRITIVVIMLFMSTFSACSNDKGLDQYNKLLKSELSSGIRADSIFMGIHFGMTGKDFFTYCWEMNKKGVFTDGKSNTAVLFRLNHNELKNPASMTFYPEMTNARISKMTETFEYDGWAPWNKHLFADSLITDVVALLKKWHPAGNDFIKIGEKQNVAYVKIDGNRRIVIKKDDDKDVKAEYLDLLTLPKVKKQEKSNE